MKIGIFGSSGHGGDVADIAIDNGYTDIVFLTKDIEIDSFCNFPVMVYTPEIVAKLDAEGYCFAIGVGDPKVRENIYNEYPLLSYPTIIHSSVTIGNIQKQNLENCRGNIFAAGSRITNNVMLGNFCFLGANAVIGHDCIIHDYVSVMPGVNISGNVQIMERVYVGTGAAILQGGNDRKLSIGENTIIGAGAVVVKDSPPNVTIAGVPAKVISK